MFRNNRCTTNKEPNLFARLGSLFSSWNILQLGLPQAVEIAVLVNSDRLRVASAEHRLGFVGQVDADTALLGLNIDKGDMVLRQHRVPKKL